VPNRNPNRIQARDERGHPGVQDAIKRGFEASGEEYVIGPVPSHDAADEGRRIVSRALEHHGYPRAARVTDQDGNPCFKDCKDPKAPHGITFRLYRKSGARDYTFRQANGNPANLKYNPYRRRQNRQVS
jgi:hypothetical protein